MNNINVNDMAFPVDGTDLTPNATIQLGLTKREYAAIKIIAGMYGLGYPGGSEQDEATFRDRFKTGREGRVDAIMAIARDAGNERLSKASYKRVSRACDALGLDRHEKDRVMYWLEYHNASGNTCEWLLSK